MKKAFIILSAVMLCVITASAQSGKRSSAKSASSGVYVGGGITFESTSDETAFALVPEVGFSLSDKFDLGVRLGYGTSGSGDSRYSVFSIKPYVRHNIVSIGKVGLLLDYQLLYQNDGVKDNKTNTFGLGVAPGLALNINKKLSVVTHLGFVGYTSAKLDVDGAEAVNKFSLDLSSEDLGLSIYYNF